MTKVQSRWSSSNMTSHDQASIARHMQSLSMATLHCLARLESYEVNRLVAYRAAVAAGLYTDKETD